MSLHGFFELQQGQFELSVKFAIPAKGVTALFGHSGSGKTTLMRCIAGLEKAKRGQLFFNNVCWQDSDSKLFMPTYCRPLGYVFQEASLFPHLSVQKNLLYGMKRTPKAEQRVVFDEAVALLGVEPLLQRKPDRLSGGERQRVGIARALLTSPRLLLMDEPMAALDANSKAEILPYLEKLHNELSIPVLYITHALPEVMKLADYMIMMKAGKILAEGELHSVLERLDMPFMQTEEAGSVIEATVSEHDPHYHLSTLRFNGGQIVVPLLTHAVGTQVRVRVSARDVSVALENETQSSILNILPAEVIEMVEDNQGHFIVKLAVGEARLFAHISRKSVELLQLRQGLTLYARVKGMALL